MGRKSFTHRFIEALYTVSGLQSLALAQPQSGSSDRSGRSDSQGDDYHNQQWQRYATDSDSIVATTQAGQFKIFGD